MSDEQGQFWIAPVARDRLSALERKVDALASQSPAELIAVITGLKCALAILERRVRELEAERQLLADQVARMTQ